MLYNQWINSLIIEKHIITHHHRVAKHFRSVFIIKEINVKLKARKMGNMCSKGDSIINEIYLKLIQLKSLTQN